MKHTTTVCKYIHTYHGKMSASAGVGITSKSNMICADPSALERTNSAVFKDCLAPIIFRRFTSSAATRGCGSDVGVGTGASAGGDRGRSASAEQILDSDDLDASELSDFIDVCRSPPPN